MLKVIVSATPTLVFESRIAWRSEPGPALFTLVTWMTRRGRAAAGSSSAADASRTNAEIFMGQLLSGTGDGRGSGSNDAGAAGGGRRSARPEGRLPGRHGPAFASADYI